MASEKIVVQVTNGPGKDDIKNILFEPVVSLRRGNRIIKSVEREIMFEFRGFSYSEFGIIDKAIAIITRYGKNNKGEKIDGELKTIHSHRFNEWIVVPDIKKNPHLISLFPCHVQVEKPNPLPLYFHGPYSPNIRLGILTLSWESW